MGVFATWHAACDRCGAPCMDPVAGVPVEWSNEIIAEHEVVREWGWERVRDEGDHRWTDTLLCDVCQAKREALRIFLAENEGAYASE